MAQLQADQQQVQQQYSKANAVIAAAATAELVSLWPSVDLSAPNAVAIASTLYYAVASKWGTAAATLAAEQYDQTREVARVKGNFRAVPADPIARAITDKAVASAFQADPNAVDTTSALPVGQRVPDRLNDSISRHVLQPGRDTIVANGKRDPAKPQGWARVTTSDKPRAFCVLMASRTNLYTSRETAKGLYTPTGIRADEDRYHKHCHCIAVPVFNQPPPQQRDNFDQYEKAKADAGTSADLKKVLASMRQLYDLK